jgi:[NiFe] hydrogenase diaphorase moiety large subunit
MPQVSTADARHALRELAQHRDPRRLIRQLGDGANAHPLVQSALRNNIRLAGRNILRPLNRGAGLRRALAMSPAELIRTVKTARLRGRGLDALPSGIRWSLARSALVERVERQWGAELESCRDYAREFERFDQQEHRCVICNACDAEPGLFRARVLMTERADRVFAGMTMVGYAIGAVQGIVYLGDELAYLRPYLEHLLKRRREDGLLGEDILGRRDVRFDIRILLGSPPYCLGEETAVINACEGRPSVPRSRPPYPTHEGYFGWPTVVHGPETLCCVATIVEVGAPSFVEEGTRDSTGGRLLCISGDCRCPGLYELPMGVGLGTVLDLAGAEGASAVFMSGSRPRYLSRAQLDGHIAFDDLATSGSVVVVGPARDPVRVWCDLAGHYLDATSAFTGCGDERRMLRDLIPAVGERRATPADITRVEEAARRIAEDTPSGFGRSAGWLILGGVRNLRHQLVRCAPGEEPDRRRAGRAR